MKTYQELKAAGLDDGARMEFIQEAVEDFTASPRYRIAKDADAYYRHLNPTIMRAQKMIYKLTGEAVPDIYRPNHKIPCRYYYYFVTQEVQFLLGNGVILSDMKGKDKKLGRDFDSAVQQAATYALNGGEAYGYWNNGHLEVFPICADEIPSFCPLYDEETGALSAGIRWWQIAPNKPMRMTLYEPDGVTEYVKPADEDMRVLKGKSTYKKAFYKSKAAGEEFAYGKNYSRLPIVPLYNVNRQSELVGGRDTLDAYDLMVSGLVNNTDEGNLIYWVLKNCNAMDEEDDAKFIEHLRMTRVAHADGDGDGIGVEHHTVEVPVEASKETIERLRTQLFDDFMALDVKEIAGGAATATQIRAAYEPLNEKTSKFEYCVTDFLRQILTLAGITDEPTYRRDTIVNATEEIQNILSAASYLDADTVTRQVCGVLGLIDDADTIIAKRKEEEVSRYGNEPEGEEETEDEEDNLNG